jgi:GAF domain
MGLLKKIDTGLKGYERVGAWIATTIIIVAPVAAALIWLRHHHVGAWVPVAVGMPLVALVVIAFFVGAGREGPAQLGPTRRERDLELELEKTKADAVAAIDAAGAAYKGAVAQAGYEKRLLVDALESIQQAVGGDEEWDIDDLVERGVLGPARGLLIQAAEEDVRMAVLVPADDPPVNWNMRWAAGHRSESVKRYAHAIDETLAGLAFRRGDFVERRNVQEDSDFVPNPKETRPFASLVALPLRIDEQIVGAFSVVSTMPGAFSESDVTFIKVVGAVINVILAMEHDVTRWALEEEEEGEAQDVEETTNGG